MELLLEECTHKKRMEAGYSLWGILFKAGKRKEAKAIILLFCIRFPCGLLAEHVLNRGIVAILASFSTPPARLLRRTRLLNLEESSRSMPVEPFKQSLSSPVHQDFKDYQACLGIDTGCYKKRKPVLEEEPKLNHRGTGTIEIACSPLASHESTHCHLSGDIDTGIMGC